MKPPTVECPFEEAGDRRARGAQELLLSVLLELRRCQQEHRRLWCVGPLHVLVASVLERWLTARAVVSPEHTQLTFTPDADSGGT